MSERMVAVAFLLGTGGLGCPSDKPAVTEKPVERTASATREETVPPPAPSDEGGSQPPVKDGAAHGLEAAKARSRAALAAERPEAEIVVRTVDGPEGVTFVRAADPKAYPGTGVAALVYDPANETTHGRRGEHALAPLVQRRGWLERRLPDADLIRLVHQAHFDGILILKDPTVEARDDGGLRVILPAHTMKGDHDRTWLVDIPAEGDETVTKGPPESLEER